MEHDDKKIREKIQNLDTIPLQWDKDLVWSSIPFQRTEPSRRMFLYYAAASIVLAATIVFYSVTQTHRDELQVRMSELDLALGQLHPTVSTEPMEAAVVECPPAREPDRTPLVARHTTRQRQQVTPKRSPYAETPAELVSVAVVQSVPESAATQSIDIPVKSVDEASKASPMVILGKSFPVVSGESNQKKGRFHIRLFQSEDEMNFAASQAPPVTTLASINNR